MKKHILLLIGILSIIIPYSVKAENSKFYEGEYIYRTWYNRVTENKVTYYQQARIYREQGTNNPAYCLEPFVGLNDSKEYYSTINPDNLTKEQIKRISLIAYYGYNYQNHQDKKWFAISQILIWQTVYPQGKFYFTASLNGSRIDPYQNEIAELESLIKNYDKTPSFTNQEYHLVLNQELELTDTNQVLNLYSFKNEHITKNNNTILIKNLPIGKHTIDFIRNETYYNRPLIFYQSGESQNVVLTGDLTPKKTTLNISVKDTTVKINKLDKDTNDQEYVEETELAGTIYQLYDSNYKELQTITIDESHKAIIKNLKYGKYYLKEIKPGQGYQLDENIYSFELTKDNNEIELNLYNEVIKAKVTINKKYLVDDEKLPEESIIFNIYNKKNELVKTLITNKDGFEEVILPYGVYKVEQVTTTNGYDIVEPFTIEIVDTTDKVYDLVNYKIKVPDTNSYKTSLLGKILSIILLYIIHV